MSAKVQEVKEVKAVKRGGEAERTRGAKGTANAGGVLGYLRRHWFWLLVNVAAAIPLAQLVWNLAAGAFVNPIDDITERTGKAAIILLILSLACTPANLLTSWRQPIAVRRSLGLWAFAYAGIHFLNFVGLDYGFDLGFILQDGLPTKPYILVGFTAFLLLVPLAITSTKGWQKRLGRNWKRLHKLAYVAGVAAVIHFLWLAKAAEDWEPLLYGLILALLLLVRVPTVRRRIVAQRQSRVAARQVAQRAQGLVTSRGSDQQ
jgi:sulfoxide reductase heme-binding subunit YedZ